MYPTSGASKLGGFTLVELAIALVVIALLIGGITVGGGALIKQSRTSALLVIIKDLATASREFKVRYGYFPGDLPNASTQITAVPAISAACDKTPGGTLGDGLVDGADDTEAKCALEHLFKAGMVTKLEFDTSAGSYTLSSAFGGQVSLWYDPTTNTNAVRITTLPCETAMAIDSKFDSGTADSKPFKAGAGSVIALDPSIESCVPGGTVPDLLIRY